jgi:hypothetical protein
MRRGRQFDPENPPKSEVLSDWTKIPHTDHLRNQRSLQAAVKSGIILRTFVVLAPVYSSESFVPLWPSRKAGGEKRHSGKKEASHYDMGIGL